MGISPEDQKKIDQFRSAMEHFQTGCSKDPIQTFNGKLRQCIANMREYGIHCIVHTKSGQKYGPYIPMEFTNDWLAFSSSLGTTIIRFEDIEAIFNFHDKQKNTCEEGNHLGTCVFCETAHQWKEAK